MAHPKTGLRCLRQSRVNIQVCLTSRPTMRRVIGATNRTAGKATAHETAQLLIHSDGVPAPKPKARTVDSPDTIHDISPDKINLNRIGAKRAGIITVTRFGVGRPIANASLSCGQRQLSRILPLISPQPCRNSPNRLRSLAQLVEHRSPKPRVVGSSPPTPASLFTDHCDFACGEPLQTIVSA